MEIVDLVKRIIDTNERSRHPTTPDQVKANLKMARREAVRELKQKGLSYREMGRMIGCPHHEVHHWLIWPNEPRGRVRA